MTGYLNRLAQRAMHIAPVVHANASLPFFPPPEPVPVETMTALPVDEPPPTLARPAINPERPARGEPEFEPAVPPIQRPDALTGIARARPSDPRLLTTKSPVGPETIAAPVNFQRQQAPEPNPVPAAPPRSPRTGPATSGPLAHRPRPAPLPPPLTRPTHPARSVPPVVRPAVLPAHPTASSQPDVHIHIGRIELTAVPDAAPPRPKAEPERKPMSLDQYLERRSDPKR